MLQIDIAQIIVHKTDQPNAFVDFLNAKGLPSKGCADVDLFAVDADSSAGGDEDRPVMEGVAALAGRYIRVMRECRLRPDTSC